MINIKQGAWLLAILGLIMVILIGILIFVPRKTNPPAVVSGITITSPVANAEVSLPINITGTVSGDGWVGFEGQVGVVDLIIDGITMTRVPLTATSEWTSLPTTFSAEISSSSIECKKAPCFLPGPANLVFHNENPSGDPARDKTFTLPVKLLKTTAEYSPLILWVYFNNNTMDPEISCNKVFAVERRVLKTTAAAEAALNELLKGPTDAEKIQGYSTSIPVGSKLDAIVRIVDGVAFAYFNETTESGGGSCSMAARVAQITQTLLQFPTITSVKLSIDGRTEDIFQP